jgi:hypothetical protein
VKRYLRCEKCDSPEQVMPRMILDHTAGRSYTLSYCWICWAEREKRMSRLLEQTAEEEASAA